MREKAVPVEFGLLLMKLLKAELQFGRKHQRSSIEVIPPSIIKLHVMIKGELRLPNSKYCTLIVLSEKNNNNTERPNMEKLYFRIISNILRPAL